MKPPNYHEAACCANCNFRVRMNLSGKCGKYNCKVEFDNICDGYEREKELELETTRLH